ncbi:Sas10/Utp3 family protein [Coccidioides immitis RMSCC 3703]|uniref:Sas10/Utp3 family protein n=1 Tax=Coccidioides immitis RMSCC 3703 TaxID=454286 RepID=A0A0J8TH19_COCIT|nr:Sas10/Utp3 family protein [Coccidioides immitis RMSCC 3703]
MGKKRKSRASSGQLASKDAAYRENSRFDLDEQFTDSADEFQAGRDRILLDEAPEAKRRRKLAEDEELLQLSDEEIHAYRSSNDEDDYEDGSIVEEEYAEPSPPGKSLRRRGREPAQDEDEEIGGWGSSKKDYYDADIIETEGDAGEEAELRASAKRRQQAPSGDTITEVLPELQISDDMSIGDRLNLLKQRYPEFEPLSKEFLVLQQLHQELSEALKQRAAGTDNDISALLIKWRVLSAYLGAISMYFVLLVSPARDVEQRCLAMAPAQLREHPIMETLLKCRREWEEVQNIQEPEFSNITVCEIPENVVKPVSKTNDKIVEETPKRIRKTKAQKVSDKAQMESELRRAERIRQTEASLEELSRQLEPYKLQKHISKRDRVSSAPDDDSDFGDEIGLTAYEAAEKAKKKKSLRFYTSQIAQKANKRDAAGRDAGGDADLPYRERLKDRQARLNRNAEKRGHQQANELERLGGDSDEDDYRAAKKIRGEMGSDSDDYYDFVAARNKQKKENKKKLAETYIEATREGGHVEVQEEIGPGGKRAITYAIEKNKGLAPKRNKDVRNPRVKKRKKFEEKKKKLGSIRPVYKGGEGAGGYGGELTGIKKNLVKSVKL